MSRSFRGLTTRPGAFNPFMAEIESRRIARLTRSLAHFLDSRRMRCPGGCGTIHQTNLETHELYGCELATRIGRGPVAS